MHVRIYIYIYTHMHIYIYNTYSYATVAVVRSFFFFIVGLFATIASFYYVTTLYFFDKVFPEMESASFGSLISSMSTMSFGPELEPIMVIICATFDLIWLAFVGALVVRHSAYMVTSRPKERHYAQLKR